MKPFPTLFWLIDPELTLAIDRLEAGAPSPGCRNGWMNPPTCAPRCWLITKSTSPCDARMTPPWGFLGRLVWRSPGGVAVLVSQPDTLSTHLVRRTLGAAQCYWQPVNQMLAGTDAGFSKFRNELDRQCPPLPMTRTFNPSRNCCAQ